MKKFLIMIILMMLCTPVLSGGYYQGQQYQDPREVQRQVLQQTIQMCEAQLAQLQAYAEHARRANDAASYDYYVWQYNQLRAQCLAEIERIKRGQY